MTGDLTLACRLQIWRNLKTFALSLVAPSIEDAALWRVCGRRDIAFEQDLLSRSLLHWIWDRDRREKGSRVRMVTLTVEITSLGDFHDLAEIHHSYAI